MLVALYSRQAQKISFLNRDVYEIRLIPAKSWTVIEDITDLSQLNTEALAKLGITTYSSNYRTIPPFGNGQFSVIKSGSDAIVMSDDYNQYLSYSKDAANEVKNSKIFSAFNSSKVDFSNVDFSKAGWSKVNMTGAIVKEYDLSNVALSAIVLDKVDSTNLTDKASVLSVDYSKVDWFSNLSAGAVSAITNSISINTVSSSLYSFAKVDFSKADFSNVVFDGLSFSNLDLKDSSLERLSDVKSQFSNGNFSAVSF